MLRVNPNLLTVQDLSKRYPDVTAVDGLSFEVAEGICFGLLGPNGAGKTTTIEMMEGIVPPTSGEVRFRGKPIDRHYRQHIGILFQKTALQDFLSVRQSLELFRGLFDHGLSIDAVVQLCSLETLLKREPRKLSGGQLQRVLLAIALINDPAVLFLDEPTTGLDPQARRNFWQLIQSIKAQRKTIVLTTHYMEEAQLLCDHIAIMDHGKIIAAGAPQALLRQHFADTLLELPRQAVPKEINSLPLRVREIDQRIEITTDNLHETLQVLIKSGTELHQLRIRPPNLEDLFLELTGRELRV